MPFCQVGVCLVCQFAEGQFGDHGIFLSGSFYVYQVAVCRLDQFAEWRLADSLSELEISLLF